MALTRRVAAAPRQQVATTIPQQNPSPEDALVAEGAPGVVAPLLDHVPTQRGSLPELEPALAPHRETRRGRTPVLVVALVVTAALVAGMGVVDHQRTVRVAERSAADVRVAAALAAQPDGAVRDAVQLAGQGAWTAAVASAHTAATAAAAAGSQQLAADVHADPTLLAGLKAAVDLAASTGANPTASLSALSAAAAGVAAPAQAAQAAEAAWQVADQARIAAAQQAAAAQAAADAAKAASQTRTVRRTTTSSASNTGTAPSPTGGTRQAIPAGGLVCPGAPVGAAASESSTSAIGAGINAYRQSKGLPALAVLRSSTLVAHAEDMAASGGIWHTGYENIVGCTSGSVQSLIDAWARSAPHNAQMLRTDVSRMYVGGATGGGWLYGAAKFSA